MYKILVTLLCVIFISCGQIIPCSADFDEYTDGLCVETNNFPVNMANLSTSISITQRRFNEFYPEFPPVMLEDLFMENHVSLEFVEYFWGRIKGITLDDHYNRETGEYVPISIKVQGDHCMYRNYVSAHEMLHVIADINMGADELNPSHMVDRMFFEWALGNDMPLTTVLEYYILQDIAPLCNTTLEDVLK